MPKSKKGEIAGQSDALPVALTHISLTDRSLSQPASQTHVNQAFVMDGDKLAGSGVVDSKPNGGLSDVENGNGKLRHKSDSSMDRRGSSTLSVTGRFEDDLNDESGSTLIYSRHEKISLKDFSDEVRACRDVDSYLRNMSLLLDVHTVDLEKLMEECLDKMLGGASGQAYEQARAGLFTHDRGKEHPTDVHQLSRTIQSTGISEGGGFDYDQNWICAIASVPALATRRVCIGRLLQPLNLGQTCQEVNFIIVILVPTKEKGTKSELEISRTFGTIFSNLSYRQELLSAGTEEEFRTMLGQQAHALAEKHGRTREIKMEMEDTPRVRCGFFRGIRDDLKRRLPHYWSDYTDGVSDVKSIGKTVSCTFFLYFACILPCIAFGVLNEANTDKVLTVEKVLYSQVFGGMLFAILGGTPQIVLLTTAPLALYTQIIFSLSDQFDLDFRAFFACVGLFNCLFLVIFSVFDLSILMQFSTRSSEEIFALFISIAFSVDAFKNCAKNFDKYYCEPVAVNASDPLSNLTSSTVDCARETSLLYLLLLLGTLWLGVTLFNFKQTPYLTAGKRELLADYALPVAVIIMSFVGAFAFKDVSMKKSFELLPDNDNLFQLVDMTVLPYGAILGAAGLGFCLSLLFFMDQNISAALVNAPQNKMKKGTAYHWDLLVIAAINSVLSILCFPWVHAALPHSPLHVMALADVEERVDQGHIHQIVVKVRETRLTCIFSHVLIGLSLLILSVLAYIPTPVLYGLFLYVAVTSLFGNQMFERIQLFFTEQSAYPPNHYIRRVPQRKMHIFTTLQLVQLVVLCGVGFAPFPYLKMFFPVLIFSLIPIRHKVIPYLVDQKYLDAMDGH